jgi:hypothetical protein
LREAVAHFLGRAIFQQKRASFEGFLRSCVAWDFAAPIFGVGHGTTNALRSEDAMPLTLTFSKFYEHAQGLDENRERSLGHSKRIRACDCEGLGLRSWSYWW